MRIWIAVWTGISLLLSAGIAHAAPTLKAKASQEVRRPENFTGIPVWEPLWWIHLEARADGAPLARLEYRAAYIEEARPTTGGWEIPELDRDGFSGRVRLLCNQLADYDFAVRVLIRVTDTAGESSEWVSVELPPEWEPTPAPAATPEQAGGGKKIGSVTYIADDQTSIADVRSDLERQARMQGGDSIDDLQLITLPDGRSKFVASVIKAPPTVAASATPIATVAARRPDRIIGKIEMGARRD